VHRRQSRWECLVRPHLKEARDLATHIQLAVVCNTRGRTEPQSNYERQSIDSRFYSPSETEFFLGSLRTAGFLVHPFFDEREFIQWVSKGQHLEVGPRKLLVISTGASFPGVGSKSLIPAFCRLHGLEIIGPDPHTASLARHKYHSNLILRTLGDIAPQSWCYNPSYGWLRNLRPPDGQRVIIKLLHEAASLGIDQQSITAVDATLTKRVKEIARDFRQSVMVQEFVSGDEVEVPLLCTPRPHALTSVGISIKDLLHLDEQILTHTLSQTEAYGFWDFESNATAKLHMLVCQLAEDCAELIGLRDLARIDFRIDKSGRPKVIDVSTSPYLNPHSSFAFAAKLAGGSAAELPVLLVALGAARLGCARAP